jgi:transcriptional regulator with XRE-family HTH domain
MARPRRPSRPVAAARLDRELLLVVGRGIREARLRRGLTQHAVAHLAGTSSSTVQRLEAGRAVNASLDSLQRVAHAVGRPLRFELAPDVRREPVDAGHLAMQELVVRLGRAAGYVAIPEMPAVRHGSWRSTDVALRNDAERRFLLVECWNSLDDVGAAYRGTNRKLIDGGAYASGRWGEGEHLVAACWVVRASVRNRTLLATYPALFAARFTGSSWSWVRALTLGTTPPTDAGLVWCDVQATRLLAWRIGRTPR